MSVLAFDCAGHACSAAVAVDGDIRARRLEPMERGHAEALMPMIDRVLEEARLSVGALDLIAVTTGPGAFTGLRIGLAAARGLALASGLPLLGVTSFAAVATQVPAAERAERTLVVALDSKRRELYLQAFTGNAPSGEGALVSPERVAAWLPPGKLVVAGDAAHRLMQLVGPERDARQAAGPGFADAAAVALLAATTWRPGLRPPPPRPLYLRAPDTTPPRPLRGEA